MLMVMTIWEPPDDDPPPRGAQPPADDLDSSALDLTLAILILSLVGLAIYYLGQLVWIVWPQIRWFPDVSS